LFLVIAVRQQAVIVKTSRAQSSVAISSPPIATVGMAQYTVETVRMERSLSLSPKIRRRRNHLLHISAMDYAFLIFYSLKSVPKAPLLNAAMI
jgi:hypothetical protein